MPIFDFLIITFVMSRAALAEIKFHDVHHSHSSTRGQPWVSHLYYVVGRASSKSIEEALAGISDEGLFVTSDGRAVSPLDRVGHKLGSRMAWLRNQAAGRAVSESKLDTSAQRELVLRWAARVAVWAAAFWF